MFKSAVKAAFAASLSCAAFGQGFTGFTSGNLAVTRSVYAGTASTVTVGQALPPNCPSTAKCGTGTATNNGSFPSTASANNVWNNDTVDGSFGITSPIYIDQITTGGTLINTLAIPTSTLVTSFSSKSELAINLSTDGNYLTLMGYAAPVNTLDVSNSNTLGVYDPTNPVGSSYNRGVLQIDANGNQQLTQTWAYSGNNGRAAILSNGLYYAVGNDNNGSGTPANVTSSTGVELITPNAAPTTPVEVGPFSITSITNPSTGQPYAADKAGKDDNFRGLTIFNNTLYVTKGSGSNGINTVYQVGNAGSLPTLANASGAPFTILPGFPVTLAKTAGATSDYPFGIWFANATTLYVGDEGDGVVADAAGSTTAGLQKWSLVNGTWTLDYVLQKGLNLGQQYSVAGYPTSLNPATAGLRNITGRLNSNGTVAIWAATSTVSTNGDPGADPNELVMITDVLANTTAAGAANEQFTVVLPPAYATVYRGIAFTPGTVAPPAPATLPVTLSNLTFNRRTATYTETVTILNNTSSVVTGPLSVELTGLPGTVTITSSSAPVNGVPAIPVLLVGATLNPGQSVSANFTFTDSSNTAFTITPVVVAQ